jgi:uncharacterized protein YbcI
VAIPNYTYLKRDVFSQKLGDFMNFRVVFSPIFILFICTGDLFTNPNPKAIYRSEIKSTVKSIADNYIRSNSIDLSSLPNKIVVDYENSLSIAENLLLETCWNQGIFCISYDVVESITKEEVDKFIKIAKSVVLRADIDKKINDFVCDLLHKNGLTKDTVMENGSQEYETLYQQVKTKLNKVMNTHFCSYVYVGEIDTAVIEEFTPFVERIKEQNKIAANSDWKKFWDWLLEKDNHPNPSAPKMNPTHDTHYDYDIIHDYEINERVLEIANQVLIDNNYEPEDIPARVVSDYSDAVQKIISRTKGEISYFHAVYAYQVKKIAEEELRPIIDKIKFKGEVCSICLDDIKPKETLGFLNCGHFFHKGCIKKALNYSSKCPLCGTYTNKIDHTEIVA